MKKSLFISKKTLNSRGFSLIELAMVIAIIGFVIGAITVGSNLIKSSELNRIITDTKEISAAADTFQAQYGRLPGDAQNIDDYFSGEVSGNGDGFIAFSSAESLQFWRHLFLAELIPINYDGTSQFVPGAGVPEGTLKNSGYKVAYTATEGFIIEFAGFTASSDTQGILKPEDAWKIDTRLDDGDPDTGIVRGVGAGCVTSGAYTLQSDTTDCRLQFLMSQQAVTETASAPGTCNGSPLGATRISNTELCPIGYVGRVIDTCLDTGWTVTNKFCTPVTCSGGKTYGETRTTNCPKYYNGIVTEVCSAAGVWVLNNPDPAGCSLPAGIACSVDIVHPCPWGLTGTVTQSCTSGTTTAVSAAAIASSGRCQPVMCGTYNYAATPGNYNLGDEAAIAGSCPTTYTGTRTNTCVYDGTLSSGNYGEWEIINNAQTSVGTGCRPNYATPACVPGVTPDVNVGCPDGQQGDHWRECVATNTWVTRANATTGLLDYTCETIKCGHDPLGSTRPSLTKCPSGEGIAVDVCKLVSGNPEWVADVVSNCKP